MNALLLDTGPLVASLDRGDAHHDWVMERFVGIRGRLVTTGAVITEAAFFLQDVRNGIRGLVGLVHSLGVEVWDAFTLERLQSVERLMDKYADVPMDFADATLVAAAEDYGITGIITLDERGFRTYRSERNKAFRLLLQDL